MDEIGWKVVRENLDGTLGSAVLYGYWRQFYAIGSRTTGHEGTPVLAFRTRQAARTFRLYNLLPSPHIVLIFKARLDSPRPQPNVAVAWRSEKFAAFWEGDSTYARAAPDGTLACDAITLLERA